MFKFFRTIRYRLMSDLPADKAGNKTSRYFKYAIGEIVLVVIGILIALQINNWNEQRKIDVVEKEMLTSLYNSIANDTIRWNSEFEGYNEQLVYGNYIKQKFEDNSAYEKRLDTAFALISSTYLQTAEHIPFNNLLNKGIDIVKNDSIKYYLNRYYEHSKFLKEAENYFKNSKYYRQHIYPKYFKSYKYGLEAIPMDYEQLKTNSEFKIALDYTINDAYFYRSWSEHKKEDALRLLGLIQEELQLKNND